MWLHPVVNQRPHSSVLIFHLCCCYFGFSHNTGSSHMVAPGLHHARLSTAQGENTSHGSFKSPGESSHWSNLNHLGISDALTRARKCGALTG